MKRVLLLAVVAGLAILATSCGGDDAGSESTADWADAFCTSIKGWTDELERIGEELGDVSSLTGDSIRDAADEADTATEEFVNELRDLGAPDTESGEEVQDELEQLADTVESEREKLREAADDASSGIGGIAEAVGTLGNSIALLGTAIQEALEAIEAGDAAGELEAALEESDACDELRS